MRMRMKLSISVISPRKLFSNRKSSKSNSSPFSRSSDPPNSLPTDSSYQGGSSNNDKQPPRRSVSGSSILPSPAHRHHQHHPSLHLSTPCDTWSDGSNDMYHELEEAFKVIDRNGDGKITKSELMELFHWIGPKDAPNDDEIEAMMREIDADGDGCVTLDEFRSITSAFGPALDLEELRETFEVFDADHDGKISAEELHEAFSAIGDERCTLEDCRRMIMTVDVNGDGFVCFEDFRLMMEQQITCCYLWKKITKKDTAQPSPFNHSTDPLRPAPTAPWALGIQAAATISPSARTNRPHPSASLRDSTKHPSIFPPRFLHGRLPLFPSSLPLAFSLLFRPHHLKSLFHHLSPAASDSCSPPYCLLDSCGDLRTLQQLHARILVSSSPDDNRHPSSIAPKLASLYAYFDDLRSSVAVFRSLDDPNTHTKVWNSIMKGYLDLGSFDLSIAAYRHMRLLGVRHDCYTLPWLNQAVSVLGDDAVYGKMIHSVGIVTGFQSDVYFCNTLIEVYIKNGAADFAYVVFVEMPHRDLVSWTSMISGFVRMGDGAGAFDMYNEMRIQLEPNFATAIIMLRACCCFEGAEQGAQFHGYLLKTGLLDDVSVRNSLLQAYANKRNAEGVEILYSECERSDVVALNILLSCYKSMGNTGGVVKRLSEIQAEVSPSKETLTLVVSSLSPYSTGLQGEQLHCYAAKSGLCDHVLATSLLTLYAECGDLDASTKVFEEIPRKDCSTWSWLMAAYVRHGDGVDEKAAAELLNQIGAMMIKPGVEVMATLVDACADLGALRMGQKVHGYCIRNFDCNHTESRCILDTCILNMYIRCGDVSSAEHCFGNMMGKKDIVAWSSMIEGYGTYGLGLEAMKLFEQMVEEGVKPNGITFLSLLSACSHAGLTEGGCRLLQSMTPAFGVEPDLLHYTCVVDLLGRSGKLKEALTLCLKMLARPDSRTWGALLSASRMFENRRIGQYAGKRLLELEADNAGYQIVMSNMQACAEHWGEVEAGRGIVGSKRTPGWSCVELERGLEGFVCGDRTHRRSEEVYEVLGLLTTQMHGSGMP